MRKAKRIESPIFSTPDFMLLAVDSKGNVHAMAPPADAEPYIPGMSDDWLTKPSIDEAKIKGAIEKLKQKAASQKA